MDQFLITSNESTKLVFKTEDHDGGLLVAKIVAMTVLGISSLIIGLMPYRLSKFIDLSNSNPHKNNLFISLMLCFGGGVLLFTTFLHLQPEVRESFEKLEKQHRIPTFGNGLPIAELVFCTGFFFVYLIEEVVHMILEKKLNNQEDEVLQRSISLRRCSKAIPIGNNNDSIRRSSIVTINKADDFLGNTNIGFTNSNGTLKPAKTHNHNHNHTVTIEGDSSVTNSFHGLLAVLALSFHAIFEGLAVGLENNRSKVWYLFAAIATHKLVIAFCVGVELVTSKTKLMLMVLYVGTFAIVTPIGIGIGIALSETGEARNEVVIATVLQGMAAGTLLYVVFFEVLARERSNDHDGIWQLMAIIVGFAVMFVLQFMTGHEHNHGHDDDPVLTASQHKH